MTITILRPKTKITYPVIQGGASYRAEAAAAASINNLHDGAMTVDGWFRVPRTGAHQYLTRKAAGGSTGWYLRINDNGKARAACFCATAVPAAESTLTYDDYLPHYFKFTFNDAGDRKVYLYIDNVLVHTSAAGVGAIVSDAAGSGLISDTLSPNYGMHGWVRWSNVVRPDEGLIPRGTPPAVDANTVAQWNVDEGSGAMLADETANDNHAHLLGTYKWNRY